jgi:single-stranded DNA-binding protein
MTAHALITGSLAAAPESKTSKAGKPYVSATVKAAQGDGMIWFRCIAFDDAPMAALGRLKAGDSLSVQGALKLEIYTPEGKEPRVSPSIVINHVIALRQENVK